MISKMPRNHKHLWSDLLNDLDISSWWQVITFLYRKEHGYSNYENCLRRNHHQIRQDVFQEKRIQQYLQENEPAEGKAKIDKILDEMCHLLAVQENPTRRLKMAGTFFLKCITQIYSSIYVNNHLLTPVRDADLQSNLFRQEFLKISKNLPIVILPTHRSYMDFLLISYIMTHYELPLPIVATGDNFKAMGQFLLNYLKSTGSFVVRRDSQRRKDVDTTIYNEVMRAYVRSILKGGENPIEFFMEGTRTRAGQVLRPKTGLLSMVVDTFVDKIVADVYIMPVAINYQRPIEEQLYVAENTPQIGMVKPKESAKNLFNAFEAVMKRKYGKVYVRFLEPFKLSGYFDEWRRATNTSSNRDDARETIIRDFTNSLASKVCLAQANNNILMPFNLIACSILARSFLDFKRPKNAGSKPINGYLKKQKNVDENEVPTATTTTVRIPFSDVVADFNLIEQVLSTTQSQFVPGWERHMEIFEEFQLNRDGIVRASADRRFIEFNKDAMTFQTLLYYSNQVLQILLPVAICSLLDLNLSSSTGGLPSHWDHYKTIRNLLLSEFFSNESFMKQEFEETAKVMLCNNVTLGARAILLKHLSYYIRSYLLFLNYLEREKVFDRSSFFQQQAGDENSKQEVLYISKDLLKNMTNLVTELKICSSNVPLSNGDANNGRQGEVEFKVHKARHLEEQLVLIDEMKLADLKDQFQQVLDKVTVVI